MHAHAGHDHDTIRTPRHHRRAPRVARPSFHVQLPSGVTLPSEPRQRVELERALQRCLMKRLSGVVQLIVLELLREGCVEWGLAAGGEVVVRGLDRAGPRRPGLWAARSIAHALAELLGGFVIDPCRGLVGADAWARLRVPADGRVRVIDHVSVASEVGPRGDRWLRSAGMAQFGLPELELASVPEADVEAAASLMFGVAQQLIESATTQSSPREVLLTVGELHWALGGEADEVPISSGRGWTRVGFDVESGRLRLRPPVGSRSWRGRGAWVRDALHDLYGSKSPMNR